MIQQTRIIGSYVKEIILILIFTIVIVDIIIEEIQKFLNVLLMKINC